MSSTALGCDVVPDVNSTTATESGSANSAAGSASRAAARKSSETISPPEASPTMSR